MSKNNDNNTKARLIYRAICRECGNRSGWTIEERRSWLWTRCPKCKSTKVRQECCEEK